MKIHVKIWFPWKFWLKSNIDWIYYSKFLIQHVRLYEFIDIIIRNSSLIINFKLHIIPHSTLLNITLFRLSLVQWHKFEQKMLKVRFCFKNMTKIVSIFFCFIILRTCRSFVQFWCLIEQIWNLCTTLHMHWYLIELKTILLFFCVKKTKTADI